MRKNLSWTSFVILFIFILFSANMIGITVAQADHDIAVVSVTPSLTSVRVGELVNITVVVENKGTVAETFNTTVYYDSSTIKTETVTNLVAGTNTSLIFTWNTTDVREEIYATDKKEKTYNINATATLALDEKTADNTGVSQVEVISRYITVIPQSTVDPNLERGMNYTVSIYTDYNGSDVWSWQFELTYNPTVLEGIEVVNGDLITTDKYPDVLFEAGDFDNSLGSLEKTNAFFYYIEKPIPTTYGPGILANVTFTVVGTGDSDITLSKSRTKLTGYNAITDEFYEIVSVSEPYLGHILHGYFRNTKEAVTHDVAILSVTPSNTTVTKGDLVNITVVVENQGTVPETITVAAYYKSIDPNYRIATTKTVQSLEAEANASLTFVWDTTDIQVVGTYSIWAEAGTVLGETDTEDNRREGEDRVTVKALRGQRVPIELAIGILVVVVLASAVVLYAVRRRRKRTPE